MKLADFDIVCAQRDVAIAELEAALTSLQWLVRLTMRERGYMTPENQIALRDAMGLLVAHGRSVEA